MGRMERGCTLPANCTLSAHWQQVHTACNLLPNCTLAGRQSAVHRSAARRAQFGARGPLELDSRRSVRGRFGRFGARRASIWPSRARLQAAQIRRSVCLDAIWTICCGRHTQTARNLWPSELADASSAIFCPSFAIFCPLPRTLWAHATRAAAKRAAQTNRRPTGLDTLPAGSATRQLGPLELPLLVHKWARSCATRRPIHATRCQRRPAAVAPRRVEKRGPGGRRRGRHAIRGHTKRWPKIDGPNWSKSSPASFDPSVFLSQTSRPTIAHSRPVRGCQTRTGRPLARAANQARARASAAGGGAGLCPRAAQRSDRCAGRAVGRTCAERARLEPAAAEALCERADVRSFVCLFTFLRLSGSGALLAAVRLSAL